MLLDKIENPIPLEPHHGFRSPAITRTWYPDTRDLTPVGHLVNKGQGTPEDLFYLLRVKEFYALERIHLHILHRDIFLKWKMIKGTMLKE